MSRVDRVLGAVSKAMAGLACVAAIALTVFVLLSAFMRYFIGTPFHFTEDIVSLLFLATAFLSIPITAHQRSYIRITLLTEILPRRGQRLAGVFGSLVFLAFVSWFCLASYSVTAFSYEIGARSEGAEIFLAPWMALMPLSMAVIGLICVLQFIELTRLLICGDGEEAQDGKKG